MRGFEAWDSARAVVERVFDGRAGSSLQCDTVHATRCRSNAASPLAHQPITPSDRMSIQALLGAKFSYRAIGRQPNFHYSSVSHEVNRAKSCATASAASCRAGRAQARSVARRAAAGAARRKLGTNVKTPLWRTVES